MTATKQITNQFGLLKRVLYIVCYYMGMFAHTAMSRYTYLGLADADTKQEI